MSSRQISVEDGRFLISGHLSFDTVNGVLAESREKIFSVANASLELDLGGVTRADSAGLVLLLEWMRMARRHNIQITFHHLPQQLRDIARAVELEPLLPVVG